MKIQWMNGYYCRFKKINTTMKNGISITLLTLLSFSLFSQSFPNDRKKFVNTWKSFELSNSQNKILKNEIYPKILENKIVDSDFEFLVKYCNIFANIQLKIEKEIYFFIISFCSEKSKDYGESFYQEWKKNIQRDITNKKEISNFLSFSYSFFYEKSLYHNKNEKWIFENGTFKWSPKDDLTINFSNGNLKCVIFDQDQRVDSLLVENTNGFIEFKKNIFHGQGGTVSWQKVGAPEIFGTIFSYKANLKEKSIRADSLLLSSPNLKNPIFGRYSDQTKASANKDQKFPSFQSFEKRIVIENYLPEIKDYSIDYNGTYTLNGNELLGSGTEEYPAILIFKTSGISRVFLFAENFLVSKDKINTRLAKVKMMYENGDSLCLEKGIIDFNVSSGEISIRAHEIGNRSLPFVDSYFHLFINAPVLKWNAITDVSSFTFQYGTSQENKIAFFESFNYFNVSDFNKYYLGSGNHPFVAISDLVSQENRTVFSEGKVANVIGRFAGQLKPLFVDMMTDGFLEINTIDKTIEIKQKLLDYNSFYKGEKQTDNLRLVCDLRPLKINQTLVNDENPDYLEEINKKNISKRETLEYAKIDFRNSTMTFNGVDKVNLSSEQDVTLFPDTSEFIMKKNRDLYFGGLIKSGKFNLNCIEGVFRYDSSLINILKSEETFFSFNPLQAKDGPYRIDSPTKIYNLTGEIRIDNPFVIESNENEIDDFPKFKTYVYSKVFFNQNEIQGGAYDSTKFFYTLDPFEIDSLDNFSEQHFELNGNLNSGGIFPILNYPLVVMPDYSLGFMEKAPEEGLSFYESSTNYKNLIALSRNGLQGKGDITFNNTYAVSKLLTFLPDSTIGIAEFECIQQDNSILFPSAYSNRAMICYQPRDSVFKATSTLNSAISMFNDQVFLNGTLIIRENGASGSGELNFEEASMKSNLYKFSNEQIDLENGSFQLRNRFTEQGENPLAIQSDGISGYVNFKKRRGEFESKGSKRILFPANEYYCVMDKFIWQMDSDEIDLEKDAAKFESSEYRDTSNFFSLENTQDSLNFKSLSAFYDLKTQSLNCNNVEKIYVGDAQVYPDSSKVIIRKNAKMDKLISAKVKTAYNQEYTNVNLDILSSKLFNGIGQYIYVDVDSNIVLIDSIEIKSKNSEKKGINFFTQGSGIISEKDSFRLNNHFQYIGGLTINSNQNGLNLDGKTRIMHDCNLSKEWIYFSSLVNPMNIQIPITYGKNSKNERLLSGFAWRNSDDIDSVQIYEGFLSKKVSTSDAELINTEGYLMYDSLNSSFVFGPIKDENLSFDFMDTNKIVLNDRTCSVSSYGAVNIGIDIKNIEIRSFGKIEKSPSKKLNSNITMAIDFSLPKNLLKIIANKIKADTSLDNYDLLQSNDYFRESITSWFDKDNKLYEDIKRDRIEGNSRKNLPKEMSQSFIISGLHLTSVSKKSRSGLPVARGMINNKDELASVVSIAGIQVFKNINTSVFFAHPKNQIDLPELNIQLKGFDDNDFLISLKNSKNRLNLLFVTPDLNFRKTIESIKPKKRKVKNLNFGIPSEDVIQELKNNLNSVFQMK